MLRERAFNYNQIKKYYLLGDCKPIEPSTFVNKYGNLFFDCFQKMFSTLMHDEITVLSGYFASDVNIEIEEVNSFFAVKDQATDIVASNMLLFELTYDLLLFEKFRDISHFFAIFGKYMKQLIGDAGKDFSDWLESAQKVYPGPSEDEEKELICKTFTAMNFIVLHEFIHLQKDLLGAATRLFKETDDFNNYLDELSEAQIEEAACDYNALYIMTSSQLPVSEAIENSLKCSATDSLAYGIIMLNANALLQLLKSCFALGTEVNQLTIDEVFENVTYQLMTRSKPLLVAAKFTENTDGLSLGNLDILKAFSDASDLVSSFFDCISGAFQKMSEVITDINKKSATPVSLTLNEPIDEDKIWFQIR